MYCRIGAFDPFPFFKIFLKDFTWRMGSKVKEIELEREREREREIPASPKRPRPHAFLVA